MPLHIFLGDEELLHFVVRVEVVQIQIWFEFKLVCNLQKGLKIYKGFPIFLRRIGPNSRSRPSQPPLSRGSWMAQRAADGPASLAGAHPSRAARSDPLSVNPTR
jgi:hypothetical protein